MSNYQNISGLELFGDPFLRPQSYSQPATQPKTTVTQPKAPVQQSVKSKSVQSEPVKPHVQQPQPPVNPAAQAKPPVSQQNPSTPAKEPNPVTPVSTQKPAPTDAKLQPEPVNKELVMDMSSDTSSKSVIDDAAKRKAHEESEAKRKAEWEAKQLAKKQAEEAAIQKLQDMSDDDVIAASTKRISTDVERLTRRNMKECVAAHIQELARKDATFARRTMHPHKNMINCFKYINRMAKDYIQQEMKDNDIKPENGVYGGDVPDDVVYKWAEEYFNSMDIEEDKEKEEKFVPKPYVGTASSKSKKTTSKAKKTEKPATKEAKKKPEPKDSYEQMSFV